MKTRSIKDGAKLKKFLQESIFNFKFFFSWSDLPV